MSETANSLVAPIEDPPTELLICPHPYSSKYAPRYREGTLVEVSGSVFECKPYPYAYYCTLPDFEPMPGVVYATEPAWADAWSELGPCHHPDTDGPSAAPSVAASGLPSGAPSPYPTNYPTTPGPTLTPSDGPTSRPTLRPSDGPTYSPSLGEPCPDAYSSEMAPTYVEGTEVEVDGTIFQCQPYPYSFYCTRHVPSPGQEGRWTDAWSEVGPCSRIAEVESTAPTFRTTTPGPTDALVLTPSPTAAIEKSPPALSVETPPPAGASEADPAVPPYPVKRFVSMLIYP